MTNTLLHFQRFEFKYLLTKLQAEDILADCLVNNLQWDPYVRDQEHKSYQVNSLYFDSDNYKCYNEKLSGLKSRFKVRIRSYGDIGVETGFLEIKKKEDALVMKDRAAMDLGDTRKILGGDSALWQTKNAGNDENKKIF